MGHSTQATYTTFGFEFQVYAGIYLMLRNIKSFSQIKIEGENEDIEITLADTSRLFAQAKSVVNQYNKPDSYFKRPFSEGLECLSKDNLGPMDKMIYISNIESRPFGLKSDQFKFEYFLTYNDLTPENREAIESIMKNNNKIEQTIDINRLIIVGFPFHGADKEEREKAVLSKIKELVAPINDQLYYESRQILSYWFDCFFDNSTKKSNKYALTKEKIIWDLIAFCISPTGKEEELLCNLGEDEASVYNATGAYQEIIYRKTNNFPDYNGILQLKSKFESRLGKPCKVEEFIDRNRDKIEQTLFPNGTPNGIDKDLVHVCALLIASKILLKHNAIKKIVKETT